MTGQRGQKPRMSSWSCRRRGSTTDILLGLLVLSIVVGSTCQQGNAAAGSWERFSRLIPTNSVYEQRDNVASLPAEKKSNADASLLRLLNENNVMDSAKAEVIDRKHLDVLPKRSNEVRKENNDVPLRDKPEINLPSEDHRQHEIHAGVSGHVQDEGDGEIYEDDYEDEEESTLSKTQDYTVHGEQSLNETDKTHEQILAKEEYHEDPSTSHYDAYYYDDDYDNTNHTRYEATEDDAVDYPDPDFLEETSDPTVAKAVPDSDTKDEEHEKSLSKSEKITSSVSVVKKSEEETSESDAEEGSSMESSNKSFLFSKPAPGVHYDQEEEDEDEEEESLNDSVLIGEAVVSVVTTKSVVNGTITIPETTSLPETAQKHTEQISAPPTTSSGTILPTSTETSSISTEQIKVTTEDSSRILASVQTSRSISGARFLPFPVVDRVEPIDNDPAASGARKTATPVESTESIIDKLDRVQSELSSGFLAGGFRTSGNTLQLDVLSERATTRRRFTTTAKTPVISKFVPRRYNDRRTDLASTTAKSTAQTLEGLLQRDFNSTGKSLTTERPKLGFRWPSVKTTASPETSETKTTSRPASSTRNTKPSVAVPDISAFLPPGYKLKKEDATVTESSILGDILAKSKVDISSLLPSNYNLKKSEEMATTMSPLSSTATSVLSDILAKSKVDLSSLLPSDYDKKKKNSEESKSSTTNSTAEHNVEASTGKSLIQDIFAKSKVDIAALLPPDFKDKAKNTTVGTKSSPEMTSTEPVPSSSSDATTAKNAGGLKIVFPSRPGGRKAIHKITTPASPRGDGPSGVTLRIQKGWPTRATTEFTGWPPNYTTQISIARLVEVARTATDASANTSMIPTTSTTTSTTTTTTTTTTPRPTTPGTCEEECEVAGTIRIVGNATWVPELLDRNTHEWQQLASELEREMNFIFSKSAILTKWYKSIRIDSFSQGSILVDYFVELADLSQKVNTQELRVIFHDSLRMYNAHRWNDTKAKGTMRLGSFTIDTKFTDFVVIPKVTAPQYIERDDRLIPQWAIAVIVIGVGGLLFIIIFGVSVLVNRQHRSKLKPSMSTLYEEEVAKNMMHSNHGAPSHRSTDYQKPASTIWNDPEVSWNDKSFESTSNKILVDRSFQDNKKYNMYDSWRSEWNGYYYNPSHTSSKYAGYDSTTNLSSRHQPDYDTNF